MFTAWNGIHRVGLRADEEDENLFVYSLVSPSLYMLFPAIEAVPELVDVTRLGQKAVRRLARDYRESVRRLAVRDGRRAHAADQERAPPESPGRSPSSPSRRRVTCTSSAIRAEAIPSAVSLFYAMWQTHSPSIAANSPETRALADDVSRSTTACSARRAGASLPSAGSACASSRWSRIPWEPWRGSTKRLGWTMTARFRGAARAGSRPTAGSFKSRHNYDLARFGLTVEDLRAALGEHWESGSNSSAAT